MGILKIPHAFVPFLAFQLWRKVAIELGLSQSEMLRGHFLFHYSPPRLGMKISLFTLTVLTRHWQQ